MLSNSLIDLEGMLLPSPLSDHLTDTYIYSYKSFVRSDSLLLLNFQYECFPFRSSVCMQFTKTSLSYFEVMYCCIQFGDLKISEKFLTLLMEVISGGWSHFVSVSMYGTELVLFTALWQFDAWPFACCTVCPDLSTNPWLAIGLVVFSTPCWADSESFFFCKSGFLKQYETILEYDWLNHYSRSG